ncbi:Tad domain-containing protein [Candidatus Woesearchaeota archaeon]|nr:Tad domain-containing protein [Candidatus Woesearchaeota archaeon]
MSKKRGQASIFMVMAVIILLLGALFFYTQRASLEKAELISPEIAPVKNFIDACISDVARQGITILGFNGGYISFPDEIKNNPRSYLQLGPISSIKNPYWWYDGIESVPSESFIARQIEDYITSNLDTCISDFSAFSQFDVRQRGSLGVKVTLNENDVAVDVNYPLELTNKLNRTTIMLEKFKETLPIRLKKAYEMAKDIYESEKKNFFLEFKTMDLIAMDKNIPTTGIETTCGEKVWRVDQVQQKLKRLLNVNLPYISIVSSEFDEKVYVPNPFGENTYKDSYYGKHYSWQITDKNYANLKVSFAYEENWPMQFYARPSNNGIMKSNAKKSQSFLDFFCLHIWHFTYDVVYPVRITITDNAPKSEPYQFNFAFEVSVDHNQPRRENFASTLFEQAVLGNQEEYCNDVVNDITIYTMENTTDQKDIAHVNLTFTCGMFTCNMGETDWLSYGAAAGLTKAFPYCVNGILRGSKEGFEDSQRFMRTEAPGTYTLYLKPVKQFQDYEIVKHDFDNPSIESKLKENEKASITIKSTQSDFETFGVYPVEKDFQIKLLNDDQEYEVAIYLSDEDSIIGGYKGTWKIAASTVSNSKKIIFHVLEKQGNDDETALFVSGLDSYSQKVPQPELIG